MKNIYLEPPPCLSVAPGKRRPTRTAMVLVLPVLLLYHLTCSSSPQTLPEAAAAARPILRDRPFVVVWNMPTAHCQKQYNVYLDLRDFDIVENRQQDFQGQVTPLPFCIITE